MLKKEAVCGERTESSLVCVSRGQVHGKNSGTEEQTATRGHRERKRFQKHKEEKNFAGGPVAKNLCSQCKGPGFDS